MLQPSREQKLAFEELKKLDANAEISWDEQVGSPSRLRGVLSEPKAGAPEWVAREFISANHRLYAVKAPQEELRLRGISADREGNRHIRFQQMYRNLPVFGTELIVHLDRDNVVRGSDGRFIPGIDLPEKPKITAGEAKKRILSHQPRNKEIPGNEPVLIVLVREGKAYLAWHMTVAGIDKGLDGKDIPAEWAYFVDASAGEVLWKYNNLPTHTRTTGLGTGRYAGSIAVNTVHNHTSNKYELEDQWVPTGARVRTHDSNNGYPPAALSVDSNNNWSAADQGPEVDCHHYSRIVFDYFLMVHGRNSYDDAGADMEIYSHVGTNWNNASWSPSQQHVKIGDGDGTTWDPFCTLDMIAHEWTHAVTEHTAGLIYYGESGALNESMSDVFAALIEGDWLHGEDCWLGATAPAGRNMADPTNGGQYDPANAINSVLAGHQPDHTDDQYAGAADNGGVHINSGIMNKAAHLIATGGTWRGITMCEALGNDVLGRLYYQALTAHLTASSDFADMRQAVLDSLDDLYAGDPRYNRWKGTIKNAFAAVGVGSSVPCTIVCWLAQGCLAGPTICPSAPIICKLAPIVMCPPAPSICKLAPILKCSPEPTLMCPPSPILACLPGPDPGPYNPIIEKVRPVEKGIDIIRIAGIGKERAALFAKKGISTIDQFLEATATEAGMQRLAESTGISVRSLQNFQTKGKLLTRPADKGR